jgi:Mu-like prophage major head subunit gpT
MIGFSEVLNNVGDFARGNYEPHVSSIANPGVAGAANGRDLGSGVVAESDREPGYMRPRRARSEVQRLYERDLLEASRLIKRVFDGDDYAKLMFRDAMRGQFREALSISDFPNLFGDIIDRAVLANYRETPYMWNMIAAATEVSDFRQVKRFRVDFGTGVLTSVEMGGPYPERKLADNAVAGTTGQAAGTPNTSGFYAYNLLKYGARMPFFWETIINDDLNAIKDTPARFGRAARRSEEKFVTKLFANNTTFFSNANFKNTVVSTGPYTATNPPLSITALAQAMVIMANQRDQDNEPIEIESVTLVIPPSLKVTAQNILNADYFFANDQGGTTIGNQVATTAALTSGDRLHVANWARNIVALGVNYYLPIVDGTFGQTGWYLFANPKGGRPALEFGRLRGHTMPELFMKLPNSIGISEGTMGPNNTPFAGMGGANPMAPMEGDFETDSIHYKVRHVFGGVTLDPLMAVYSNGSGS